MFLPNCIEYPLIFAAAPGVGMTLTTLNPIYTAREITKQLKISKAQWAVTTNALLPTLVEAIEEIGELSLWKDKIIIVGG